MPRHFLDAAPNSRDRPLGFNIVASVAEVNVQVEVVRVLRLLGTSTRIVSYR
jgi:predicted CoA-binding protein